MTKEGCGEGSCLTLEGSNVSALRDSVVMSTGLSTRPQQKQPAQQGSSRYAKDGTLFVKHNGQWMAFPRYAAAQYLERNGLALPSGCRVERRDASRPPTVNNLILKFRGKQERTRVIDYVKESHPCI